MASEKSKVTAASKIFSIRYFQGYQMPASIHYLLGLPPIIALLKCPFRSLETHTHNSDIAVAGGCRYLIDLALSDTEDSSSRFLTLQNNEDWNYQRH